MRRSVLNDNPRLRAAGFTIMELMITVAIAAVLLGFGIPSFRGIVANNRLISQTNEFIGVANFARSTSITRNASITFCRADSENDDECATDEDDWQAWLVLDAAGEVLRSGTVNTYGGQIHVITDLTDQSMTFQPDGMARTGANLVADNAMWVCTTQSVQENFRVLTFGAGSRLSVAKDGGSCP